MYNLFGSLTWTKLQRLLI